MFKESASEAESDILTRMKMKNGRFEKLSTLVLHKGTEDGEKNNTRLGPVL